jgi:hypothetical protein
LVAMLAPDWLVRVNHLRPKARQNWA